MGILSSPKFSGWKLPPSSHEEHPTSLRQRCSNHPEARLQSCMNVSDMISGWMEWWLPHFSCEVRGVMRSPFFLLPKWIYNCNLLTNMNSHISPKIRSLKWNNEINESDCMEWFMRLHHEKMAAKMEFRIGANSYAWPFNCTYIYIYVYPTRTDPTNFRSLCLLEPMIWVVIVFQKTPLL